jgi:hypothetical protein
VTKEGSKISDLTKGQAREQLADETDPKAIKYLTAAREHLEGLSPAEIEDKYGWDRQPVYNWLNRFEERGLRPRSITLLSSLTHKSFRTH